MYSGRQITLLVTQRIMKTSALRKRRLYLFLLLLFSVFGFLFMHPEPVSVVQDYAGFSLVGIVGAIFANATGAGGGVVFVPLFNQFELTPMNIVATSFAIQCCGMVAGAISWRDQYVLSKQDSFLRSIWRVLPKLLWLTIPFSFLGIWTVQYSGLMALVTQSDNILHWVFGCFSILLAVALFVTLPKMKQEDQIFIPNLFDKIALPIVAFAGGMITAWLSVGVGELVAVYLILRNASVTLSIACAVILTAFSVWSGIGYFVLNNVISSEGFSTIVYPIVAFAGIGAIVGGTIAKHLVLLFNPVQVKMFFATWVMFMGVASLPWGQMFSH